MPVYIRNNLSFTPTSIDRMSDEEDDDYLLDPDQLRDELPQPYRMINKVIIKLLEDVWDIIELKDNKRLTEERKIRPPKYDQPTELPFLSAATSLASSADGRYLFAGLPNGLLALEALSQQQLSQWEEEGAEITSITTYPFTPNSTLLVTIDDMAVTRLFLFACDWLFFIKVLNESVRHESEGGHKMLTIRCEASVEGDYVGIVLENPSSKEVWFEAHRVPREAWTSELEAIEEKLQEKREKQQRKKEQREKEEKGEQPLPSADESANQSTDDLQKSEELKGESPRVTTPPSSILVDRIAHKFSAPTLVLKVKPPVPYAANASSSIFSATQRVDNTGLVLGTGQTHIMTAAHLESRDTTFQHMHASLINYMARREGGGEKKEDKEGGGGSSQNDDVMTATFHFLNPGRMLLTGAEPLGQIDHPTCVALWWKGSNHLLQYSLLKVTRDVEHKPDMVWPYSCAVSASAVSPCTSHLAVGLTNGNVCVWDRYIGVQRGVVNVNTNTCLPSSEVQLLRFLDPSLYLHTSMDYPPYPQRSATYLLVQCQDSSQFIHDIGRNTQDCPVCIGDRPDNDDEVQTLLQSVPDLPELSLMVQKDGTLYLKDMQSGLRVCQLAFQPPFQLVSPWEPVAAFGGRGQLLFVKGSGLVIEEGEEEEGEGESEESKETKETKEKAGVFMYTLRSYPTLDQYWSKSRKDQQLRVHPTLENRMDALMKERMAQQVLRKHRLQMRWGMLRSDLSVIQNAREVNVQRSTSFTRPFNV